MQPQTRTRLDCQIACIAHIWQRARMAHVLIRIMSCFRADIGGMSQLAGADQHQLQLQHGFIQLANWLAGPSAVEAINGATMLELQIVVSLIKN